MPQEYSFEGWSYEKLRSQRNRAHFLLEDPYRYVTVILSPKASEHNKLYCIDSACYHAAGPLGEGEVVEIEDMLCLQCPWHRYLVSLDKGEQIWLLAASSEQAGKVENPCDPAAGGDGALGCPHLSYPTYPLKPTFSSDEGFVVQRKRGAVQRIHTASLDEATSVLTITVDDQAVMTRQPVTSDRYAGSLERGAICMEIADIKARGLDKLF